MIYYSSRHIQGLNANALMLVCIGVCLCRIFAAKPLDRITTNTMLVLMGLLAPRPTWTRGTYFRNDSELTIDIHISKYPLPKMALNIH